MSSTLTAQARSQKPSVLVSKTWIACWLALTVLLLIQAANRYYLAVHLASYPTEAYPKAVEAMKSLSAALFTIVVGVGPITWRHLVRR
jgi:hypothetical protein